MKRHELLSLIDDAKDAVIGILGIIGIAILFGTVVGVCVGSLLGTGQLVASVLSRLLGG